MFVASMAAKCQNENQVFLERTHVHIFNRGGYWKINKDTVAILSVAEVFFLSSATNQSNNIDIKPIAINTLKDSYVLTHFSKIRNDSPDSIKNKTAFSRLEDLLTLYLRIRVFSFVKK